MVSETDTLSWTARMSGDSFDIVSLEVNREGELIQKDLLIKDFIAALNEAEVNDALFRVGKLPRGYYDGSVIPESPNTFRCVVVVPSGSRVIRYYDTDYHVVYPTTVFVFCSEKGNLNKSMAFFANTDTPDEQTTLYQYCFANVSSNGHICWGSNALPKLESMKDCDKLVALFFGSPCNDDYYSYARFVSGAPEYCRQQRALYEHLKECKEFPFEILAATEVSMEDLLTEL